MTPILHQYPASAFSEKVRLVLGLSGTPWRRVEIPAVMPKPLYTPLTGGYRRTPSLQRGADIFCDSACIIDELLGAGGLELALGPWSDQALFRAAVTLVYGRIGDRLDEALLEDRRALTGTAFDVARMRAAVPVMRQQLRAGFALVDQHLQRSGAPFLAGEHPGLEDVHAWFVPWTLEQRVPGELARLVAGFGAWPAWAARMAALGHGAAEDLSAEAALAEARDSIPETLPEVDPQDPLGLRAGQWVEVAADDWGRDAVAGELVVLTARRVAVLRHHARVGEVVVHFPRTGYVVTPVPRPSHSDQ